MNPLKSVAAKFGGVAKMAKSLRRPQTTVSNWVIRDNAKRSHLQEIYEKAQEEGIDVRPEDFFTIRGGQS